MTLTGSDTWTHCLYPLPAHQGSSVLVRSLSPVSSRVKSRPVLAAAATQTVSLQLVFPAHSDRFLPLPQCRTTQVIISLSAQSPYPWNPPVWAEAGTLASPLTKHLLWLTEGRKTLIRREQAFHLQKPKAPLPLLEQQLGWPHIPSNNRIKGPYGQRLPAQSLAPPSRVVLRKLLGLSGPFSSFRKWELRNTTASP